MIIFVSPHLDDVVISCACHILAKVRQGQSVLIVTVFTHPGKSVDSFVQNRYKKRRREDCKVAKILGAETLHLGLKDAPYRNRSYCSFNTILFHKQNPKDEEETVNQIYYSLSKIFSDLHPTEIFFPLGVGGHIDHHIVFECSRLFDRRYDIHYYEDLPYALVSGWSSIRWNNIQGKILDTCSALIQKRPLLDQKLPFIDNYCTSEEDRTLSFEKFEDEWKSIQNTNQPLSLLLNNYQILHQSKIIADDSFFKKKCHAISGYSTEWPILFGSHRDNISHVLCSKLITDPVEKLPQRKYTEIFWSKVKNEIYC